MNQTVSEKSAVDYLFVVDNCEPKQLDYERFIGMSEILEFFKKKGVTKTSHLNYIFIIYLSKYCRKLLSIKHQSSKIILKFKIESMHSKLHFFS